MLHIEGMREATPELFIQTPCQARNGRIGQPASRMMKQNHNARRAQKSEIKPLGPRWSFCKSHKNNFNARFLLQQFEIFILLLKVGWNNDAECSFQKVVPLQLEPAPAVQP